MKKVFTLFASMLFAASALVAKDYTDILFITVDDEPANDGQVATIIVEQKENGDYEFTIKNFVIDMGDDAMPIGDIMLSELAGTTANGITSIAVTNATPVITDGDDEQYEGMWFAALINMFGGLPVSLKADFNDEALYAEVDLNYQGQIIHCVFGDPIDVPTGIQHHEATGNADAVHFDLSGRQVTQNRQSAILIVHKADGSTVKMLSR